MEQKKGEQVELRQQSPPALRQVQQICGALSQQDGAGSGSSAEEAADSQLSSAALQL